MDNFVNIADVCSEIFAGGDAPKSNMSATKTDEYKIPIFSNGEADNGLYGYTNFARVTKPSITVSARGTIGFVAARNEPFVPIVRLISLTPNPEKIELKYLYYAIQNYKFDGSGTSIPQLTVPMLKKYSFPLPTKEQQLAVIDQLDNVCNLISLRKQQLSKLDELVKSRFIELFGDSNYPYEPLDNNVIEMFIGPFGSSLKNEFFVDEEDGFCMVYEQKHAIQKTMDVSTRYVPKSKYEELKRFTVLGGDIIVSCRGTIGEIYTVPNDAPIGIMHPSIMKIRLNTEKYNQAFFVFALEQYMNEHSAEAKGSGVKMAVSATVLGQSDFVVPPMEVQNQFAAFVEQTDKSKLAIQQSLEKLETLKKALMQKYFG